jgi:translation initiation factor IF-1
MTKKNKKQNKTEKDLLEFEGQITEILPNQMFRVMLDNEHTITAYTGGKMRQFRIRMIQGDRVTVEMSPYDLDKGRIIYRN